MPDPETPGKPKLGGLRWVFAIFGGLIMVFSGGCGLVWLAAFIDEYGTIDAGLMGALALMSLVPFLAGLLIWYLAVKAGR